MTGKESSSLPLGPKIFAPTPVVGESRRARSFQETLAWVKPLLSRVPITRLVNATPLDFIGLPVWSAVTPMAKDLTVHAGKGRDSLASQLSAIMEAIERVCAESVDCQRTTVASYEDLRVSNDDIQPVDPQEFDLPFETNYQPDRAISWVVVYDLIQRRYTWAPTDLIISPAREGVCMGVETNGLASGNTYVEAVLHGLLEVIERDAVSQSEFCLMYSEPSDLHSMPIRMVDSSTLPSLSLSWVTELTTCGLKVVIQDLTNDIDVSVFGATIIDPYFPAAQGEALFAGYGADLDPGTAVFRAISEAVQSHTIVTLGARDAFEGTRAVPDRPAMLVRRLATLYPTSFAAFPATTGARSDDLCTDLETVLDRLSRAGFSHCYVADLMQEHLGVPVVRLLVPGLSQPYGATSRRPGLRLLRTLV